MKNAIYGSLVTVQYHAKCNNSLTEKSQVKIAVIFFVANLYGVRKGSKAAVPVHRYFFTGAPVKFTGGPLNITGAPLYFTGTPLY